MTNKLRALFSGLFLATLLATTFISVTPASAARLPICAQTAYVRDASMRVIDTIFRGQTVEITRYTGSSGTDYAYGFAYGNVNKWGYIIRNAFWGC